MAHLLIIHSRSQHTYLSQLFFLLLIIHKKHTTPHSLAPPVFDGDNYQIRTTRMEAHLEANDLWEAVEEDYEVLPLPTNRTMTQIKNQKERKTSKVDML